MQPTRKNKTYSWPYFGQLPAVGFMSLLLIFLTCINYFLYPPAEAPATVLADKSNQENSSPGYPFPAGPDEKSPDAPVNINEEYVHECSGLLHAYVGEALLRHKIHEAEKLCIVHAEQFYPPPEV